jgi:hypothetical protein
MHTPISQQTKAELLQALRQRYLRASKQEKAKILDEFVAVAGCHRKHAIRLLTGSNPASASVSAVARRIYDEAVRQALIVLWEAADRICGKRLKAVLPSLVTALERHGHLARNATVRQRVLAVSAATIDRLPDSVRSNTSYRKKRKTATKPSKEIPVEPGSDGRLHGLDGGSRSGGAGAVPGGRGPGGDPSPVPRPDQGDRLGQRQCLHQRDAAGPLSAAEAGVHALAGLPEERLGLDRAEERCSREALRRL